MKTPVFRGTVAKGSLQVELRFYEYLRSLEGNQVEVIVRKARSQRSLQQNRYYWGVIVQMLGDHCGYTSEEMHEALKEKFLGYERSEETELLKIRSTAVLSPDEFVQYTNRIVMWAAQKLSVYIPDPGSVDF